MRASFRYIDLGLSGRAQGMPDITLKMTVFSQPLTSLPTNPW